ncbi:MAG: hypothetical protein C5B51_12550 [Terriglobia bacterium]|nr:MAG: hypothetical protein C5B51_12550 [Terriglobia bacterium]
MARRNPVIIEREPAPLKRFAFLDWMRGLAVLIMIQCHAFNSFTRLDLRQSGSYMLTQFIGGMAAPLFLFMAGMTAGFQMESLEARKRRRVDRWVAALRRAVYILFIAYLFRFTNWLGSLPKPSMDDFLKVDILNCMGLAMLVFAAAALFDFHQRLRITVLGALAVAAVAPVMSGLDWSGVAPVLRDYLVPSPNRGRFAFFPCAAYLGFGIAAGSIVKRTAVERMDRMMQWAVLLGFVLVFGAQYFASVPYSIYANADFWRNSPALILIRVGIALLLLAGAYVWTEFCTKSGWSWMQNLGKTSLMVYWVHVMLVYGSLADPLKGSLTVPLAAVVTLLVIVLMVLLAELRLRWKLRYGERWRAGTTVAGPAPV